jgi:type IV pilus assembly protein PilF
MKILWNRIACYGATAFFALWMAGCVSLGGSGQEEIRTNSDMSDVQKRASLRVQLAAGYYQQQQWNVALDEIKKALAIDPDNADAYNIRAMIYMEMKETELAEDNFQHAMYLMPSNPDLANNYGWFLCQNGRPEKSIYHFEKAFNTRSYQSPETALNNAGVCSMKMKKEKEAEEYLNKAFRIDPTNPSTNANLAKLYYMRTEYERAHFYINRVTKADALTADHLWTAVKIERKRKDRSAEGVYVSHLRRLYPSSTEFAAYQRGMFDE